MPLTLTTFDAIARAGAAHIVNTAVGSLLLALMAWCLLRLLPKENAGTRFAVWLATLLGTAALPVATVLAHHAYAASGPRGAIQVPEQWALYVFGAWALISSAMLLKIAIGICQLRRLRAGAITIDPDTLGTLPRATVLDFQAVRPVTICESHQVSVPTAVGFFRAAVLLPAWTLSELSPADLNSVLVHELAHLRRRDDWTNLLQKLIRAAFFFCPAVWWIESRLALEREMACDEHVLASHANPRAYAECLVNLAERRMLHRAVLLAQGAVHRLRQCSLRVACILNASAAGSTRVRGLALAAVGAASAISLVLLAEVPGLVAFQSSSHGPAAYAFSQAANKSVAADVSVPYAAVAVPMVTNASWRVPTAGRQRHQVHSAKKVAHIPAASAQQRTRPAPKPALPLYRAEFSESGNVPATLVVVTQTFSDPDGMQVWTMSVYRLAVAPRSDAATREQHLPKRI